MGKAFVYTSLFFSAQTLDTTDIASYHHVDQWARVTPLVAPHLEVRHSSVSEIPFAYSSISATVPPYRAMEVVVVRLVPCGAVQYNTTLATHMNVLSPIHIHVAYTLNKAHTLTHLDISRGSDHTHVL